jgi:hypothetical protein
MAGSLRAGRMRCDHLGLLLLTVPAPSSLTTPLPGLLLTLLFAVALGEQVLTFRNVKD